MSIQKLFGINGLKAVSNPYNITRAENNFAKNAFNFGEANPNRPNGIFQKFHNNTHPSFLLYNVFNDRMCKVKIRRKYYGW